jgi:predicted DNA-binding protein
MKKSSVERVLKGIRIKKVNAKRLDILAEHQSRKINATLDLIIEYYFENNPTDQKL